MTTAHNHPPRCCCGYSDCCGWTDPSPHIGTCPLCPEHGELAQLAGEPQPGECPICHQPIGREHTDYCRLTGPVSALPILDLDSFTSRTSTPPTQARTPGYDGPEGTEWPRYTPSTEHIWGQDTHYPPEGQGYPHHISQCGPARRNCPLPPAPTTDDNPR